MSTRKILLVDESADEVTLTQRTFKECRILNSIQVLADGYEALEYLDGKKSNLSLPVLVLLDLRVPRLSGKELLRHLGLKRIGEICPIVVLSGDTDLKEINDCYKLGAKSFLTKPVSADDLMNMVTKISGLTARQRSNGWELDIA